jgi:hypothetical protein
MWIVSSARNVADGAAAEHMCFGPLLPPTQIKLPWAAWRTHRCPSRCLRCCACHMWRCTLQRHRCCCRAGGRSRLVRPHLPQSPPVLIHTHASRRPQTRSRQGVGKRMTRHSPGAPARPGPGGMQTISTGRGSRGLARFIWLKVRALHNQQVCKCCSGRCSHTQDCIHGDAPRAASAHAPPGSMPCALQRCPCLQRAGPGSC